MRMPGHLLEQQLGPILEGILLWAEDSKNKFKLKVGGGGEGGGRAGRNLSSIFEDRVVLERSQSQTLTVTVTERSNVDKLRR